MTFLAGYSTVAVPSSASKSPNFRFKTFCRLAYGCQDRDLAEEIRDDASNPKESAWFRDRSVEPERETRARRGRIRGMSPEGRRRRARKHASRKGTCTEARGEDLTNEDSVKEYEVERVGRMGTNRTGGRVGREDIGREDL